MLKRCVPVLLMASLGFSAPSQAQDDPRELMFQARIKQRPAGGDDPTGAVALYRRVVTLEPGSSEAQLRLSEALVESGDLEGAVVPAIRATELNPRSGEAWWHLAQVQYFRAQSRPELRGEVRKALQEASHLLPNDPEVWFRLAQLNQLMGDDPGALKAWLSLGRLHPSLRLADAPLEQIAWERAALLGANLDNYEARREAIMGLADLPHPTQQHLPLLEELAREQADKGFLGHAEESFRLLGEHYPEEPAIWENISRIQLQTGRYEEALRTYRQAEALRPLPRLSYFQGICLMSLGRMAEAEGLWKRLFKDGSVQKEEPEFGQNARFFYAASLLAQSRPAETLALLRGWPESDREPELAALKAQSLIQTQDWKAARVALEEGMKRFPDQSIFQSAKATPPELLKEGLIFKKEARQALAQLDRETMASLWFEFRQWDRCLELVQQALATSPVRRVDLLMMQSNALDQLGRPQEAIQVLRQAQALDPGFPMLQNNLGYLLLEHGGDLAEASRLIEAAMKQDPKNGSTVDSWGWVLYRQGQLKEAEAALRKATELTPLSPEIRMHLGEVLLKLARPQEALEQWERALAFVFPERKTLEEKIQKLRVELARRQSAEDKTSGPAPEDDDSQEEDTP